MILLVFNLLIYERGVLNKVLPFNCGFYFFLVLS